MLKTASVEIDSLSNRKKRLLQQIWEYESIAWDSALSVSEGKGGARDLMNSIKDMERLTNEFLNIDRPWI